MEHRQLLLVGPCKSPVLSEPIYLEENRLVARLRPSVTLLRTSKNKLFLHKLRTPREDHMIGRLIAQQDVRISKDSSASKMIKSHPGTRNNSLDVGLRTPNSWVFATSKPSTYPANMPHPPYHISFDSGSSELMRTYLRSSSTLQSSKLLRLCG